MATVRCILQPGGRTPKEVGDRHPVYIRVSDRGKREYFVTGFYANSAEFDNTKDGGRYYQGKGYAKFEVFRKENGVLRKYYNKEANDILAKMRGDIKSIIDGFDKDNKDWTLNQLRDAYKVKRSASTFASFAEGVVNSYKEKGKYQHAAITQDAIRTFRVYDTNFDKRTFREIDADYIKGYIAFYQKDEGERKANRAGAISIRLREIRAILNKAIKAGVGSVASYPFGKESDVVIPQPDEDEKTNNQRRYISTEGLKKLAHTTFENPMEELSRHIFLFLFHCRGMNFRDAAELTTDNVKEVTMHGRTVSLIVYNRSKTKRAIQVEVTPSVKAELDWFRENTPLLNNYLLPIILKEPATDKREEYIHQRRKRINAKLKVICKSMGLPESQTVSVYGSRHSYAMFLYDKEIPMEVISAGLNHKNMRITQNYIDGFSAVRIAKMADTKL